MDVALPTKPRRGRQPAATLKADLYLAGVDPLRYFAVSDCQQCGCTSCGEWLDRLRTGALRPGDCPSVGSNRAYALEVVLSLAQILPEVEITQHPVAGLLGRQEINRPGPGAPVLVTGNGVSTQEVVLAVLSTTTAPFHLLYVDCLGHSVDMAMIYGTFTPEGVARAMESSGLPSLVDHRELILPGITAALKESVERRTGWSARVGPLCAGELPLFLGEMWMRPERHGSR